MTETSPFSDLPKAIPRTKQSCGALNSQVSSDYLGKLIYHQFLNYTSIAELVGENFINLLVQFPKKTTTTVQDLERTSIQDLERTSIRDDSSLTSSRPPTSSDYELETTHIRIWGSYHSIEVINLHS